MLKLPSLSHRASVPPAVSSPKERHGVLKSLSDWWAKSDNSSSEYAQKEPFDVAKLDGAINYIRSHHDVLSMCKAVKCTKDAKADEKIYHLLWFILNKLADQGSLGAAVMLHHINSNRKHISAIDLENGDDTYYSLRRLALVAPRVVNEYPQVRLYVSKVQELIHTFCTIQLDNLSLEDTMYLKMYMEQKDAEISNRRRAEGKAKVDYDVFGRALSDEVDRSL
jgi:hypothetical protein